MSEPLVSVVTPFHNTAPYLAQCIESVLAQSYSNFEYILADNCSTDGGGEIAESYARRDRRIRVIRRSSLLKQVPNYNAALAEISSRSQFCKVVQADDSIFPECLQLMVRAFEQSENIGLVSAYDLKANTVRGSGFPFGTQPINGKEVARLFLRSGIFVFGSPTTVMYRSSIVNSQHPFYAEGLLHEDSEKCMQILEEWDFAFVPQVLSFIRTGNESISSGVRDFQPYALDRYILVTRFASAFLEAAEAEELRRTARREYYGMLAEQAIRLRDSAFWEYHAGGVKTIGETVDWYDLALAVSRNLFWMAVNPGATLAQVLNFRKRRMNREAAGKPVVSSEQESLEKKEAVHFSEI